MTAEISLTCYYVDDQFEIRLLPFQNINHPDQSGEHKEWVNTLERIRQVVNSLGMADMSFQFRQPLDDDASIILLLVRPLQLCDPQFLDKLAQSTLRKTVSPGERHMPVTRTYAPIITISSDDLLPVMMGRTGSSIIPEASGYYPPANLSIDQRSLFLDSSIWHRYVPELSSYKEIFEICLKTTLRDICTYWKEGLYHTISAVSMLEFQVRMLQDSFIGKFGKEGHEGLVTPFKFHSERLFRYKLKEEEEFFMDKKWNDVSLLESLNWRVLIVDDYAKTEISTVKKSLKCQVTKAMLIWKPFQRILEKAGLMESIGELQLSEIPFNNQFVQLIAPEGNKDVVAFALKEISTSSYDLILLDYLLGYQSTPNSKREYGDEFLQKIIESNNQGMSYYFRRDIQGQFWIFPISSFPYALPDRLYQLGITHLHSIWHLSHGSDPLTAPYAYAYYLLRFMKQKIRMYFLDPRAMELLFHQIPEQLAPDDISSRKLWAGHLRDALLRYESQMNLLKRSGLDDPKESFFSKSILDFVEKRTTLIGLVISMRRICEDIIQLNGGVRETSLSAFIEAQKQLPSEYHPILQAEFIDRVREFSVPDLKTVKEVNIFIMYGNGDEACVTKCDQFFTPIKKSYRLNIWHKGLIDLGGDPALIISQKLEEAHIFMCLWSLNFENDNEVEEMLLEAASKSQKKQAKLIPVIIGEFVPSDLSLMYKLKALPKDTSLLPSQDRFWVDVVEGIMKTIKEEFGMEKRN